MARRGGNAEPPPEDRQIEDVNVSSELRESFLEYAYSVIYSRALPDARDGLKPVQRRILFQMAQMGLRPDRGHVKSARVVGEVMGRLHPHGDSAIYDALVRLSQSFSQRLPMIDGHGNFGSLDDGPAAMRYTECRLAAPALDMTASLDENVVDFAANYDGRETEPIVLPAAVPNLLVNGVAGIAVGMATNMPPHNLGEVIAAARHLLEHPGAETDALMRFVPGPDLPTGGTIVGLDGIREAYLTGKGSFRMRATTTIEQLTARRKGIVVTSLPYNVGPERLVDRVRALVQAKKLQGVADLVDLTDGEHGLRLELHIKSGFNPDAVLAALHRSTPLEEQFSINSVSLVDGQPRVLGLKDLLQVFLDHRLEVVRRRTQFRVERARDRLHLVEGLLVAIIDIDEVIQLIRASDDAAAAKRGLMDVFDLSSEQATYILDMPLRRLTKFSRIELETERDELAARIEDLMDILDSPDRLRREVSAELADVAERLGTPRRTVLLQADGAASTAASAQLEVSDDPCIVLMSSTGLIARTASTDALANTGERASHDVIASTAAATGRGQVGVLSNRGEVFRLSVLDLPTIVSGASRPALAGGAPLGALLDLPHGQRAVALVDLTTRATDLAIATRDGVLKRSAPDVPSNKDSWPIIRLADGDEVVGAAPVPAHPGSTVAGDGDVGDRTAAHAVFITSDAHLLHFPIATVRAQGRTAGGVAGVRLSSSAKVIAFGVTPSIPGASVGDADADSTIVTIAGSASALPGTEPGSAKVTRLSQYPAKGRATGGVRCMRFVRGQDCLSFAWVGLGPALASTTSGTPVDLPALDPRRDGSGTALDTPVASVGGSIVVTDPRGGTAGSR